MTPGAPLALSDVGFVVVDTETTGGSPSAAALTEIAAVRYRGGVVEGTLQTLVDPGMPIPPFISGLTGITDAMVADAPAVAQVLPSLLEFARDSVIVGHNIRFDLGFLDAALARCGRDPLDHPVVDTLSLARRLVRDEVTDCRLGTLARELRLPNRPCHRALSDVLATGDLLHRLLEDAATYGVEDLEELIGFARALGSLRRHPGLSGPGGDTGRHSSGSPSGSPPGELPPSGPAGGPLMGAAAHPLRSTARLPRMPGSFWFSDASGRVLSVGWGPDLRAAARAPFFAPDDPVARRLVRRARRLGVQLAPDPETARHDAAGLAARWRPALDASEVVAA